MKCGVFSVNCSFICQLYRLASDALELNEFSVKDFILNSWLVGNL